MNLEQREEVVAAALEPAFRRQLLARGQARSLIWRDGVLPDRAPSFVPTLSHDLVGYGSALLLHAMNIRRQGGDQNLTQRAFIQAAEAIEAVVVNGPKDHNERGFLRVLSAMAFHLGHSSARAYSLLAISLDDANLSRLEYSLSLLILRKLDQLEELIIDRQSTGVAADNTLVELLASQSERTDGVDNDGQFEEIVFGALDEALRDRFDLGLGSFLLALQSGDTGLVERAQRELQTGLSVASDMNLIPQWWTFRLAIELINDLWSTSFHQQLPQTLPDGGSAAWQEVRSLFIATLLRRRRSEIELWPSQIEGARRAVDSADNLVVSLPTSAGKTRIAELCILRCLSAGQRVVFLTPLRTLSAQAEAALQRTFRPLGKSVSALYGGIGTSVFEEDTLRTRDIVVATPEKFDFALRNDPSIIDDVGLVVLDEGHMIGLGEREVRYEIQIQRLLRRSDANERRIVCLSASLPDGEKFDDFVSWIRQDRPGDAIKGDWRPTRQRFGVVLWRRQKARLELEVGNERPFVPTFFSEKAPLRGRRTALFPRNKREFVIATAWRLLEDNQSVLIYCPERRSVRPYATAIVDLVSKGFIDSAFNADENILVDVITIGNEWLGTDHPILQCLKLGVAIHHGALPTPFRKEMERLLRAGHLRVTVSSPTLAQGLNLSATSIIMHDIYHFRDGRRKVIEVTEFTNIAGRAGRAYVDVEGLILFPIFDNHRQLQEKWKQLTDELGQHDMESGLFKLLMLFLVRLNRFLGEPGIDSLTDYVLNNAAAWSFPDVPGESEDERDRSETRWNRYLPILDTALLSLVGEEEISIEELSLRLDELLSSSFWKRRIAHHEERLQGLLQAALVGRANIIWNQTNATQRRGYFLAGVGLATGQALDALASELNSLLVDANTAILEFDQEGAVSAVLRLAEMLFDIPPFVPHPFPDQWKEVLESWLKGESIVKLGHGQNDDILRFVENGIVYKLAWAVDAVRVRARANRDDVGRGGIVLTVDDLETDLLGPCLETGTLNPCAARLMQTGFRSRLAAIKAVTDTDANFVNAFELVEWLKSDEVFLLSQDQRWPTADSHRIWLTFIEEYVPEVEAEWFVQSGVFEVIWDGKVAPDQDETVRLLFSENGECTVLSTGCVEIGRLDVKLARRPAGLFNARVYGDNTVRYQYRGPKDIVLVG